MSGRKTCSGGDRRQVRLVVLLSVFCTMLTFVAISHLTGRSDSGGFVDGRVLVAAARAQIGVTKTYDPSYAEIDYPNGDVPLASGVCSDVIIRALRDAAGIDLQRLVHEDIVWHKIAYPIKYLNRWADANIDHRRVSNLRVFFRRKGWEVVPAGSDVRPGDILTMKLSSGADHIVLVGDRRNAKGGLSVIHNIGAGTVEEAELFSGEVDGHFRARRQGD